MIKQFVNRHKVDTEPEYRSSSIGFSGSVQFRCVALRYFKTSKSESISVGV